MDNNETTPGPQPSDGVEFVGDRPRSRTIKLEWPVSYQGKEYAQVTVRRLKVGEVADFLDRLRTAGALADGKRVPFPMYDVPAAVIENLDDDDAERVGQAVLDFLPRRFREGAASEQAPTTGENSPASSPTPSGSP